MEILPSQTIQQLMHYHNPKLYAVEEPGGSSAWPIFLLCQHIKNYKGILPWQQIKARQEVIIRTLPLSIFCCEATGTYFEKFIHNLLRKVLWTIYMARYCLVYQITPIFQQLSLYFCQSYKTIHVKKIPKAHSHWWSYNIKVSSDILRCEWSSRNKTNISRLYTKLHLVSYTALCLCLIWYYKSQKI